MSTASVREKLERIKEISNGSRYHGDAALVNTLAINALAELREGRTYARRMTEVNWKTCEPYISCPDCDTEKGGMCFEHFLDYHPWFEAAEQPRPMTERTNAELAEWGIEQGGMMLREIQGSDPRMVSPKVRALAEFAVEAAEALRAMPEGERFNGHVRKISPDVVERLGFYITDDLPGNAQPAVLILTRKEGESR